MADFPTLIDEHREHWSERDWAIVFGDGGASSPPEWRAATPPPKATVEPITASNVDEVTHFWASTSHDDFDRKMKALMRLHDGRWACVETWSDTTGYGCADATEWHIGTREDVIRWGLSDDARTTVGIPPEGDDRG